MGLLKTENAKYKNNRIETINVAFDSKILSLKDRLGEDKIADLGTCFASFKNDSIFESIKYEQEIGRAHV